MFQSADGRWRKNGPWERNRRGVWLVVERPPVEIRQEYEGWRTGLQVIAAANATREVAVVLCAPCPAPETWRAFVVEAYVPGTYPRRFIVLGKEYHAGDFAEITAHTFGRGSEDQKTFYHKNNDALCDAGLYSIGGKGEQTGTSDPWDHHVLATEGFDAAPVALEVLEEGRRK